MTQDVRKRVANKDKVFPTSWDIVIQLDFRLRGNDGLLNYLG